jgi:hypothetical protein
MMLCDNEVDNRLWDGAHENGWRMVQSADAEGCARGTIRYTYMYVAPSGERLRSKTAAFAEHEGTSQVPPSSGIQEVVVRLS